MHFQNILRKWKIGWMKSIFRALRRIRRGYSNPPSHNKIENRHLNLFERENHRIIAYHLTTYHLSNSTLHLVASFIQHKYLHTVVENGVAIYIYTRQRVSIYLVTVAREKHTSSPVASLFVQCTVQYTVQSVPQLRS